jgi:hypothetical protein
MGSWPGMDGLAPCAVFLLALALVPHSKATLGADGGVYLERLHGAVLRGRPFTHPGAEPGVVILLAPFYLLGHGVAVGERPAGLDVAANGVEVNGRAAGSVSLTPEGRSWEAVVPAADWRPGLNEIRFRAASVEEGGPGGRDEPPFAAWRLEEIAVGPVG